MWALFHLQVPFIHVVACESDPLAITFWKNNFNALHFCNDMTKRDHADVVRRCGAPDLYMCGFPCPTFSVQGAGQGVEDPRGQIIFHVIAFLQVALPSVFILENVEGLVTRFPSTLTWIIKKLKGINNNCYHIDARVMNTAQHGVPHHRKRLFIIGVIKAKQTGRMSWPEPIGHRPLSEFLEPLVEAVSLKDSPPETQKVARSNWVATFEALASTFGKNPLLMDVVADMDGTKPHFMMDMTPCITRSRVGSGGIGS